MNKMTKRLLACCCALPLHVVACDEAGETVWVNLQLMAAQQTPVEWPLLQGHIKANVICIDKKMLAPRLLQTAALTLYIHPLTDLTINIDNASQRIKAGGQMDVYGVAGLPTVTGEGKTYLPPCVLQHLDFQEANTSTNNAGRFTLQAQAKMPAAGECQGADVVRQAANVIPAQWSLDASFILLDAKQTMSATTPQDKTVKEDKPGKLEQFLNLPPADEAAKKRMKKR